MDEQPETSSMFMGVGSIPPSNKENELDHSKYVPADGYWSPEIEKIVTEAYRQYIFKLLTR